MEIHEQPGPLETLASVAASVGSQDDLLDQLGAIRMVELAAEQARRHTVREARAAGFTWEQIGSTLGTTRQAAHERYGRG